MAVLNPEKLVTKCTSSGLVAMLLSSAKSRLLVREPLWTPTAITRCRFFPVRRAAAAFVGLKPKLDAPSVKTTKTRGTFNVSARIPLATVNTLLSTLLNADDVCVPPVSCVMFESAARAAASVNPPEKNKSCSVRSENCESATCDSPGPTVRLRISWPTKALLSSKSLNWTDDDPSTRNAMSNIVTH